VLDSKTVDFWEKDEDVLNWLEQANLITPDDVPALSRTRYATPAQGFGAAWFDAARSAPRQVARWTSPR